MSVSSLNVVLYMFDRSGSVCSSLFSVAYTDKGTQPRESLGGIYQLMSVLASLCIMGDAELGFNNQIFDLPEEGEVHEAQDLQVHTKGGRKYLIKGLAVSPDDLYGFGSIVYGATELLANSLSISNEVDEDPGPTHTLKLQWHARPWENTRSLYAHAQSASVQNLVDVEESLFGDLVGDGFRWHAQEDTGGQYADIRPRLLIMRGAFVPISFVLEVQDFIKAFSLLLQGR